MPGFRASGVSAGIKKGRALDLALLVSDVVATCAGCVTRNRIKAAPLIVTQARLRSGRGQTVLINSGNANACTGRQGIRDARQAAQWVADSLGISSDLVLLASTGVIGEPLPMEKVQRAVPRAVDALSRRGGRDAAAAILTTDTKTKALVVTGRVAGTPVTVGGMAKGAGMIHPDMATMLAFLATDAVIGQAALRTALRTAVAESFNRISVDGETSTNDLVLCLANGLSGTARLREGSSDFGRFVDMLRLLCHGLARLIVRDGEGATKFVVLRVTGARRPEQARRVAQAVAKSPLVKTALFGEDPNWGRIMAVIGASGVKVPAEKIGISFGKVRLVRSGLGQGRSAEREARRHLKGREVTIGIDLGCGRARFTYYTTDLSDAYVRINADYRT